MDSWSLTCGTIHSSYRLSCNLRKIAQKNHQEEKLSALRAALLNVAIGSRVADDRREIFLSIIDACSETHLRVFKQLHVAKVKYEQENKVRTLRVIDEGHITLQGLLDNLAGRGRRVGGGCCRDRPSV